jgi:hypothetical protein
VVCQHLKPICHIYPVRNNGPLLCGRLDFRAIPAGFDAPLDFLTGLTKILIDLFALFIKNLLAEKCTGSYQKGYGILRKKNIGR